MVLHDDLAGVSSSPETAALYKALCQAQKKYRPIKRSGRNAVEGFDFSTLKDICDALMPGLLENGFCMPTFATGYDRNLAQWVCVGTLAHESGEWISAVCPLLMGWPEHARPTLRELEIDCTYAKKVLMQGLCGGWPEGPEGEEQVAPPAAEPEALPVKKQRASKKPESDAAQILARADAALTDKAGDEEGIAKILGHLSQFVDEGRVPKGDVMVLIAKHKIGGRVTKVIDREASDAE